MLNKFCLPAILLISIMVNGQYKNDNVLYKTVDPSDLCATLEKNKGYLLLDVRSPAEYADTASSPAYNLGHLRGSKNIDVRELGQRLAEIKNYKDQPVFVYCSHSQRSRRAGKMLADSGFAKVFNINGGMTAVHYTGVGTQGCLQALVETGNKYSIVSAAELCSKIEKDKNVFILDVRSDSAFRHITMDAKENALGVVRGAINIPLVDLQGRMGVVPKGKGEIIITDMYGDDAGKAAVILMKNGYNKISVLIEGIDRLLYTDRQDLGCRDRLYISPVAYQIISAPEFGRYSKENRDHVIVDVRATNEFANTHKDYWRNIGHLKNAINIPVADIGNRVGELDRNKEILLYAFSSGKDVFEAANELQKRGFSKIKIISGGIFNLRWTAANVKNQSYLKDLVVEVPEINR